MLLRRLAEAIRKQNWFTVIVEVLIVVVGIFIGLQVDDWNELRKERNLERRYLESLAEEISQDIDEMEYGIDLALSRRAMGQLLLQAVDDPTIAREDPTAFITAIEQACYTFLPAINDSTFEEAKFSGRLSIIRNDRLRRSIVAYYQLIERNQQWGYLRESFQVSCSNAGVGILTAEQLTRLQSVDRYIDPAIVSKKWEFSQEDADQTLARMRTKQDFIDQLPRGTAKEDEIGTIRTWLYTATALRDDIMLELG
jgi:hypothetical protein